MYFVRKMTRRRRQQIRILASIRSARERIISIFRQAEPSADWPRHEQYIHAAWTVFGDLKRQSLGYFLCDPPRFVPCPHLYAPQTRIGMEGVEKMCGSIPWEHVFFWAPFRNEED